MEIYNCRRYEYENGSHVTFYKRAINCGNETEVNENFKKSHDTSLRTEEQEKHCISVSATHAKNRVYRIARSNKWDWFITLTFDRTKTDASDYDIIVTRLHKFLSNIQQRKCPDMKYLIIPELHADKKHYHFHGLLSDCDGLHFIYSGRNDRKSGLPIYNIKDWGYGFTTATRVQHSGKASSYITKYITKDTDSHLREKRRYYASRNVNIVEEERYLLNEENFLRTYADRITYMKTVNVPQGNQQISYYEVAD